MMLSPRTKCAAVKCDNDLTEWELKRQTMSNSRYHFCRKCRTQRHMFDMIICKHCNKEMIFNGLNIVCDRCKEKNRKKIYERSNRKKSWATKEEWILHLLRSQKADINMICAFVKTDCKTAKQLLTNLRQKGHNIRLESRHGFYMLEEIK